MVCTRIEYFSLAYRPPNHSALDEARPEDAWVSKEREWTEQQLEEVFVCFATIENPQVLFRDNLWRRWWIVNWLQFFAAFLKFAVVRHRHVSVEMCVPDERCYGYEKDDQWKHRRGEYSDHVECPLPANRAGHLSSNHGREECTTEQAQIAQCHSFASFVNKVQISDAGIDQCFEGRKADALEEPRSREGSIRMAAGQIAEIARTAPCR